MSRAAHIHLPQRLPDHIVRLPLCVLRGLDRYTLVYPASVVGVELAECVGKPVDVRLLELRVFPVFELSAELFLGLKSDPERTFAA